MTDNARTGPGFRVRRAVPRDAEAISVIYNQGIEDRIATLETEPKTAEEVGAWLARESRYAVLVAETAGEVVGWAALNPYAHR
ncbi:N-acetyltransferase family protein [Desulforudis sp. 1031]|uniref:GNAT family N-acetyltransferase n=1 Tax=unclassified Candidatus Desulforudis TaxID=2635950 RepID=UPI003CE9ECF6